MSQRHSLSRLLGSLALTVTTFACGAGTTGNEGGGGGGGDGVDAGDGAGTADPGCEQIEAIQAAVGDPPDILLVVDKSGSMEDPLDSGDEKWPVMRDALDTVVTQYESSVRFGLMLYPQGDSCDAGAVEAAVAMQNAAAINGELSSTSPDGGTPTHTTLAAARAYYQGLTAVPGGRYVLLATDGEPNCGDPNDSQVPTVDESIAAIEALLMDEVQTFVLGFGGAVNNYPETLQSMAVAGGTGDYFAANSPGELATALDAIAAEVGIPSCSFRLDQTPPDESALSVYQDGAEVPRDPGHQTGWDYDAATNTVTFYGASCDAIHAGDTAQVKIDFGCVEDVVE